MKRFILLTYLLWNCSLSLAGNIVIVIDPGHGGKDPGHLSHNPRHATEAELNLKIAKLLGGYIEQYLDHVDIYYTRTDDTYPSLDDRVNLANEKRADYFISIHCNGSDRKSIHGTESHVHDFSYKESYRLAHEIEHQFATRAGRTSRGIKDSKDRAHSIQVLKFTRMTSVLVECGFMTNEREANYLNSSYGQEIIASAIFRGIRTHLQKTYPDTQFKKSSSTIAKQSEVTTVGYSIRIMSSKIPLNVKGEGFRHLPKAVERKEINSTNSYKYIYLHGEYSDKSEAEKDLLIVKKRGYPDAIIIAR